MKAHSAVTVTCSLILLFCVNASFAAQQFGADKHMAKGLTCEVCHGGDKSNPIFPEEKDCIACHNKGELERKTSGYPGANPHAAPHNGDCVLCHMQHEAPVNYCAQCHKFDFKVPG